MSSPIAAPRCLRDRLRDSVAKSLTVVEAARFGPVEKTMWSSPAGKTRIAKRLAALLPPHSTYVEPFAGSGAVFFAKEPAKVEVLNDADPDIAEAYRLIKKLTPQQLASMRKMSWEGDAGAYKRIHASKPTSDVEKLRRFLYLAHFSYGRLRGSSFNPGAQGSTSRAIARLEKHGPRLKKVHVYSGDYEKVVRKYDGKDTVFFLDPPYAGYDAKVGEKKFDEQRFFKLLKSLRGKWLLTYGIRGELPKLLAGSSFHVKRFQTRRSIGAMRGAKGPKMLTQILASNYALTKKALDDLGLDGFDVAELCADDLDPADVLFERSARLLKAGDDEERFVLGVVLEPETVDAHGDVISAEEIRQAAHRFMAEFRTRGLQHQVSVNDEVQILESFIARSDFEVEGQAVKRGSWLMGMRVDADDLWAKVKRGELTGFSIGGAARRLPERGEPHGDGAPPAEPEVPDAAPGEAAA